MRNGSTGVLDLQRRSLQIGRMRLGQQVPTGKTRKDGSAIMRPDKLDVWRFTSPSQRAIEAAAGLLGGSARPWMNGKRQEWEVITKANEVAVTVPPRDAVISQHYELWSAGGCQRRCNSQVQQNGQPCACPHAEDTDDEDEVARKALERADLAKLNPPEACHLITRISLNLPDLPGVGVWRLDTGSFYAAGEMMDQALIMEMARDARVLLPAVARIEQRTRIADGKTRNYPVPVLDLLPTLRQLATGALEQGGMAAQLPPAPGERPRAITSGQPAPTKTPAAEKAPAPPAPERSAQAIANDAAEATTRGDLKPLITEMDECGFREDGVITRDEDGGEGYENLHSYLVQQWERLPDGGKDS